MVNLQTIEEGSSRRRIEFRAQDRHTARRLDTDADAAASGFQDNDSDVAADANFFTGLSGKH
jgi:hypothetical protein